MTSIQTLLTDIAAKHLGIETLEERHSDSLDFHDVSVWGIESALLEAYQAGQAAAARKAKRGSRER